MKRFRKKDILKEIRLLSLQHMILPVIFILISLAIIQIINFDNIFNPKLYRSSFDAFSAYKKGEENVTIHVDTLKYTGYNIIRGDEVVSVYYYDLSGEQCMFYKLDMNYKSTEEIPQTLKDVTISARLTEQDGLSRNMMESFAQSINWTYDGLSSITFPVIMDEHEYNLGWLYILYIMIILIIFYSLFLTAGNILVLIAPYLHPAYMKIRPYYKHMSYFDMIDMINQDFEEHILVTAGKMYLTDRFFINLGNREVCIMPLDQILLAYNHGQLFALFGIHLRMNHTLHLYGSRNIRIHASNKKATHVTIITDYLREHYPTIIWGHTKENLIAYKQLLHTEKATKKVNENIVEDLHEGNV